MVDGLKSWSKIALAISPLFAEMLSRSSVWCSEGNGPTGTSECAPPEVLPGPQGELCCLCGRHCGWIDARLNRVIRRRHPRALSSIDQRCVGYVTNPRHGLGNSLAAVATTPFAS
jgi:hypothetical protein